MEYKLHLGDAIEVTATGKFIGFLFKADENELILCSSERFNPQSLISIRKDSVTWIDVLKSYEATESAPVPAKSPSGEAQEAKILPFVRPGDKPEAPKPA